MNHESQGDSSDRSIKYRVGVVTLKRLVAGLICFKYINLQHWMMLLR